MISLRYLLASLFLLISFPASAQYFDVLYDHAARPGILNGEEKTFLVTGYSTSHRPNRRAWPMIFGEMLDAHAGNNSTYHVVSHTVSGTPIAKWMGTCGAGGDVEDALASYVNPGSRLDNGIPPATIMLAQQSLQWAFGNCQDRFISIESANDTEKIQQGVVAIQEYMNAFFDGGVQEVYMATHIFKENYPTNLCGERFALAEALGTLDNFYPGPELCEMTGGLFPEGYQADRVHPGPEVASAMALYWYLVIAGEEAKPEVYEPIALDAGISVPVRTHTEQAVVPESLGHELHPVYPNPFNDQTTLSFYMHRPGRVNLGVYNQLGQLVNTLVEGNRPAGSHQVIWDGTNLQGKALPSGIYFIKMATQGDVHVRQSVLIR